MRPDPPAEEAAPFRGRLELAAVAAGLAILALVVGIIAFIMPAHQAKLLHTPYRQSGVFRYHGVTSAGSVYGSAGLTSGQPVVISAVRRVRFEFAYTLTSTAPAAIHGSRSLRARLTFGDGLTRSFTLAPQKPFNGAKFHVGGVLDVGDISRLLGNAEARGFENTGEVTLEISPEVRARGFIAGQPLKANFSPSLTFHYTGAMLTLEREQLESSSGAAAVAGTSSSANPLTPRLTGASTETVRLPRSVPLLLVRPSVDAARIGGLVAAGLLGAMALLLGWPLLRREDDEAPGRIRMLYGSELIDVSELAHASGPVADVESMAALARLAKRYESMIMHLREGRRDSYCVWDQGLLYRYRPQDQGAAAGREDLDGNQNAKPPLPAVILDGQRAEAPQEDFDQV